MPPLYASYQPTGLGQTQASLAELLAAQMRATRLNAIRQAGERPAPRVEDLPEGSPPLRTQADQYQQQAAFNNRGSAPLNLRQRLEMLPGQLLGGGGGAGLDEARIDYQDRFGDVSAALALEEFALAREREANALLAPYGGGGDSQPYDLASSPLQSFSDFTDIVGPGPSYPVDELLAADAARNQAVYDQIAGLSLAAQGGILGADSQYRQNRARTDALVAGLDSGQGTLAAAAATPGGNAGAQFLAQQGIRDNAVADAVGVEMVSGQGARDVEQAAASYARLNGDLAEIANFQRQSLDQASANATTGALQALALQRFQADSSARIAAADRATSIIEKGLDANFSQQSSLYDAYVGIKTEEIGASLGGGSGSKEPLPLGIIDRVTALQDEVETGERILSDYTRRVNNAASDASTDGSAKDLYVSKMIAGIASGTTSRARMISDLTDITGEISPASQSMIDEVDQFFGGEDEYQVPEIFRNEAMRNWLLDYATSPVDEDKLKPLVGVGALPQATYDYLVSSQATPDAPRSDVILGPVDRGLGTGRSKPSGIIPDGGAAVIPDYGIGN